VNFLIADTFTDSLAHLAAQEQKVRERVEEIVTPALKPASQPAKPKLFGNLRKFELMAFSVPAEWVEDVPAADEDTLFDVIAHLPQEAHKALLKLAVGEKVEAPSPRRPDRSLRPSRRPAPVPHPRRR